MRTFAYDYKNEIKKEYIDCKNRKCCVYVSTPVRSGKNTVHLIATYILLFIEWMERVFASDAFAAAFSGICLLMTVGIVGGVEFGLLSLAQGVGFSSVTLIVLGVFLYKKNKE